MRMNVLVSSISMIIVNVLTCQEATQLHLQHLLSADQGRNKDQVYLFLSIEIEVTNDL